MSAWEGRRPFEVTALRRECRGVTTLRLEPCDGEPLPLAGPGQYLTCFLRLPGEARPAIRCYSLSHAPQRAAYQITVKQTRRADGSPGRVSSYLQAEGGGVEVGTLLDLQAPQGEFTLDPARPPGPLVFLAGGVGITPFMSILEAMALTGGDPADPARGVSLYYGVRDGSEHAFREALASLATHHPWLRQVVCYSQPRPEDAERYERAGRVDLDLLRETLPPADLPYTFFLCGPPPFLDSLLSGLGELGVPPSRIRTETFGASSVRPLTGRLRRPAGGPLPRVRFARSEVEVPWDPAHGSLLDLAMASGVFFPFACAAGHCGTCVSGLLEGEVDYGVAPQFPLRAGQCLPCIALPKTDLSLDV